MRRNAAPQADADHVGPYRPVWTAAFVLVALALSWAYLLCGFLPEPLGGAWRRFLLSNPHNPPIGVAPVVPALAIPMLLAFRHGRSKAALGLIIAGSYLLAVASEWMMRGAVRSWAALDLPPFNMPFWTTHRLVWRLIIVTVAALIASSWRRGADRSENSASANGGPPAA
jgi:hypothetical protein